MDHKGYKVGDVVGTLKGEGGGYIQRWGWYGVSAEAWAPNMIVDRYKMQDDSIGKRIEWVNRAGGG